MPGDDVSSYGARALQHRISAALAGLPQSQTLPPETEKPLAASAVVVPVGLDSVEGPCLIFNKRSQLVRQPGDLCFPGGSPEPRIDPMLAALLLLPGSPLKRWPHLQQWRNGRASDRKRLSLMLAAGLRESFEEMRMNPLGVRFLGPLPARSLVLFRRVIHPMVVWVGKQHRFRANWEVDRIVRIRIRDLLDPRRYRRHRIVYDPQTARRAGDRSAEFPAYRHEDRGRVEILWGATYRITAAFLSLVFDFTPPVLSSLPRTDGFLDESYYAGPEKAFSD